jgi:hypothetical protein
MGKIGFYITLASAKLHFLICCWFFVLILEDVGNLMLAFYLPWGNSSQNIQTQLVGYLLYSPPPDSSMGTFVNYVTRNSAFFHPLALPPSVTQNPTNALCSVQQISDPLLPKVLRIICKRSLNIIFGFKNGWSVPQITLEE